MNSTIDLLDPGLDQSPLSPDATAAWSDEPLWTASPTAARIMIVDDEPTNFKVVRRYLSESGYADFITTSDSTQAMSLIEQRNPHVVLLDLIMPNIGGLEILRAVRADAERGATPVIILTAAEDRQLKLEALNAGATDFLCKPVDPTDLVPRVRNAIGLKLQHDRLRGEAERLQSEVRRRTAELEASRLEVIHCLGRAAEYRDHETGRHVIRVGMYVAIVARELGMPEEQVQLLEQAAPLHDMGKIGIPDSILLKPGRLTDAEMEVMRRHAEYGRCIVCSEESEQWLGPVGRGRCGRHVRCVSCSPLLRLAASIAATHHEKWDGTGYPRGLRGREIPVEGRLTAVADVFDALNSRRPYKLAIPAERCFEIMRAERGRHFDPRILDAFLRRRADVRIRNEFADDE